MRIWDWSVVLIAAVLLSSSAARADGDFYVIAGSGAVGTKISSLPLSIDNSGFYYLTRDITCDSGNGITVNVANVTIDLMGFTITGNSNSTGILVYSSNVKIRNGTVCGWHYGIWGFGGNIQVSNITAYGNKWIGIELDGDWSLVNNCNSSNNGGGIFCDGGIITGCVANNNNIINGWGTGIGMWNPGSVLGNVASKNRTNNFWLGNGFATAIMVDRNSAFGLATNYFSTPGTTGLQEGINASGAP